MSDYIPNNIPLGGARGVASVIRNEFQEIATAVNSKADLSGPALTDTPTAPTAAPGTNSTQIATTAFAMTMDSPAFTGTPTSPTATPGTNTTQLATTAFVAALGALKANLASPEFTGVPTAPTATPGTSSAQLATTAFVAAQAFEAALPDQTGKAGEFITTDGTTASWTGLAKLHAIALYF